jgi:hypothetical protein
METSVRVKVTFSFVLHHVPNKCSYKWSTTLYSLDWQSPLLLVLLGKLEYTGCKQYYTTQRSTQMAILTRLARGEGGTSFLL